MRYLALDIGDKRTGVAVGDSLTRLASPAGVLQAPRGEPLLAAVINAIAEHAPDEIVVGLPLNMDDSEGPRALIARQFADELRSRVGLPVHFQDERLTSFAADQAMSRTGRTRREKKQLRDALAAVEILRDFLQRHEGTEARRHEGERDRP